MIILTMCFSLIGEVVENKVKAIKKKMGLGEDKLKLEEIIPNKRESFHSDNVESFITVEEETFSCDMVNDVEQEDERDAEDQDVEMADNDMDSFADMEDEKGR